MTHLGTINTMTAMASQTTRNIATGWKKLGLVIILILGRETVIKRKMMEPGMIIILERMRAIAEELGPIPVTRRTCEVERGLELLCLKRGRERAIAWKPGSILMTTVAKGGKLSTVSMMDPGRDRMSCLGNGGTWGATGLTDHVEDDIAALIPVLILRF